MLYQVTTLVFFYNVHGLILSRLSVALWTHITHGQVTSVKLPCLALLVLFLLFISE